MYSVEGLKQGIKNGKDNIRHLKKAIKDQESTIADYKIMLDDLEKAEKKKKEAKQGIHVEVVSDGDKE